MPLSEHEKRLLDEIEQTLRIDDPALASSMRNARPLPRTRTLTLLAVAGLIVGAVLLVTALQLSGVAITVVGVLGFAFVVAGADCGLRAIGRMRRARIKRSSP